jgi:nucleotide-binding universal stress UspA family protein
MSYKEIFVHLDCGRGWRQRLSLACAIARQQEAHLVALYGVEPRSALGSTLSLPLNIADVETVRLALAKGREDALAAAASVQSELRGASERAGVNSEWRVVEAPIAANVCQQARYADLIILGQVDPDDPPLGSAATLVEDVLMGAGRPLLLVPYVGNFPTIGKNVLVAWNASREAARALGDALPLIKGAEKTTVLYVDDAPGRADMAAMPTKGVARYLTHHGIQCHASQLPAGDEVPVGEMILSRASDFGTDLIVMGGYGHSRMRELVLGGVTRALLHHMTVPVLMSH